MKRFFIYTLSGKGEPWCSWSKAQAAAGFNFGGLEQLLGLLEEHCGFFRPRAKRSLEMALAGSALRSLIENGQAGDIPEIFAENSAALAGYLLDIHDSLVMAGWNGDCARLPERIAGMMTIFKKLAITVEDNAQRIERLCGEFESGRVSPLDMILCAVPQGALSVAEKKLLAVLEARGCEISTYDSDFDYRDAADNDLGLLQTMLCTSSMPANRSFKGDGSVFFVESDSLLEAAETCAAFLQNTYFSEQSTVLAATREPLMQLSCVLKERNMPDIDMSASAANTPLFQFFPLYLNALRRYPNAALLYEYLRLPLSPLGGIRFKLAKEMGEHSGRSARWNEIISGWLASKVEKGKNTGAQSERIAIFLPQGDMLVEGDSVPKEVIVKALQAFRAWCGSMTGVNEDNQLKADYFRMTIAWCDSMAGFLEMETGDSLSLIQLTSLSHALADEFQFRAALHESGGAERVEDPALVMDPCDMLLWWDFIMPGNNGARSLFTCAERIALAENGIEPVDEDILARVRKEGWIRAVCMTQSKLVLFSRTDNGRDCEHPLWSIAKGLAGGEDKLRPLIKKASEMPEILEYSRPVEHRVTFCAAPVWSVAPYMSENDKAISVTNIETLLRCPVRFLLEREFRHYAPKMQSESLALGNAAHAIIEECLLHSDDPNLMDIIRSTANKIIAEECISLLEDGKQREREFFLRSVEKTVLILKSIMDETGMKKISVEQNLESIAAGIELSGKYDLLLEGGNGSLVLDMKYSAKAGRAKYTSLIRENLAFQPAAYARMLSLRSPGCGAGYMHIAHHEASVFGESGSTSMTGAEGDIDFTFNSFTRKAASVLRQIKDGEITAPYAGEKVKKDKNTPGTDFDTLQLKPNCEYCDFQALCGIRHTSALSTESDIVSPEDFNE